MAYSQNSLNTLPIISAQFHGSDPSEFVHNLKRTQTKMAVLELWKQQHREDRD